jgi:membrane protease YdiL (CAAX protease family)
MNALSLCLGVGIAEEIIFRAWLWTELQHLTSRFGAVIGQALVFSVVHTRFNLGVMPMLGLLTGPFPARDDARHTEKP